MPLVSSMAISAHCVNHVVKDDRNLADFVTLIARGSEADR